MGRRITILIENEIDRKIRIKQAKLIKSSQKSVSYSKIINDLIRKNLK